MRHEPGRACDHENAVERGGVHSKVGKDRADRAVHVDGQRFFRVGERFLDRARGLHMCAVHASFARELEQARSARVFRVETMTKSRHALARFPHRGQRARSSFIH